ALGVFGEGLPETMYLVENSSLTLTEEASAIQPGKAYWVYYDVTTPVTFDGTPPQSNTLDQTLSAGWNMIAYPFSTYTTADSFAFNSSPAQGVIDFYEYDPETGSYTAATAVDTWGAFWIYVEESGTLTAYNPAATGISNVVLSADTYAAVYSPVEFDPAYVPATPEKIESANLPSSELALCWSSNYYVVPLEDTAYSFTLSATDTTELPGGGYTIAFETGRLIDVAEGYTVSDAENLKCASCNTRFGEWVVTEGTYYTVPYLDNSYGIACKASEFTDFVVVIDQRPDPLPAPAFNLYCGDGKAYLAWDRLTHENNIGYVVYDCGQTSCTSVKDTISDPDQTRVEYTATNGTEVCYAIAGMSSNYEQDSTWSDIKCVTPSSDPGTCSQSTITLISPEDAMVLNSDTDFVFTGAGDVEYYFISVSDTADGSSAYTDLVYGEGAGVMDGETFSAPFNTNILDTGHEYSWDVSGTQVSNGNTVVSQPFTFTYIDPSGCTEMTTTPNCLSPANGSAITATAPIFVWQEVQGATEYLVQVYDSNGYMVSNMGLVSENSAQYSGTELYYEEDYQWVVRAHDGCGTWMLGDVFMFSVVEPPTLEAVNFCGGAYCAPQQSDAYDINYSNNSITLYWEKPESADITQFKIYRCKNSSGVCDTYVATHNNTECSVMMTNVVCYEDVGLDGGAMFYYNVTSVDSGGNESLPSDTLDISKPLKGPTLLSPSYDTVIYVPQPEFQWYGENGATTYTFQIVKRPDSFIPPANLKWQYTILDPTGAIETGSTIYNQDGAMEQPLQNPSDPYIAGNQYQWRVCSSNALFPTPVCTNPSQFYKNMSPPGTISPDSGSQQTTNQITFSWTVTSGASGYTVRLCEKAGVSTDCRSLPIAHQADVPGGSSISYEMTGVPLNWCDIVADPDCSEGGAYFWEIQAYDIYGEVSGSWENQNRELFYNLYQVLVTPEDWTTLNADTACPTTTDYFGDTSFNYEVDFSWNDFSATGSYSFKITELNNGAGTETVIFETVVSGTTLNANTNCGASGVDIPFSISRTFGTFDPIYYTWSVTAEGNPYNEDIANYMTSVIPPPTLVSPANGASIAMSADCDGLGSSFCATFTWDGGIWGATVPRAEYYDIEIIVNDSLPFLCWKPFSYDPMWPPEPPYATYLTTQCELSTVDLSPGDTITWSVRSRDDSGELTDSGPGFAGNWSEPFTLNVTAP
ncbi:hypothetical protein ACFLQK_01905, partial [bacterium]